MNAAALVRTYLPHSPALGLHVAPDIPEGKLRGALRDYAPGVRPDEVLALYDNTAFGSAKDGALFLADRLVFQNNDTQAPQSVRFDDIVGAEVGGSAFLGRRVEVAVNRGRATVTERLDCSAHAGAAEHVARFLHQVVLSSAALGDRDTPGTAPSEETDRAAVEAALDALVRAGHLSGDARRRMLGALDG